MNGPLPAALVALSLLAISRPAAGYAADSLPNGGAAFTNSLGMVFVPIPGAPWFSVWETRVQDYGAFLGASARGHTEPGFPQAPAHPVVNVTWEDAQAFCQWLTARERKSGMIGAKDRYRLPTDVEWSMAAGLAPEAGKYPEDKLGALIVWPWGSYWPPRGGEGNYAPDLGLEKFQYTAPAGQFTPNRAGLHDLGGNVWEWCEDWFSPAHVTRVLRGGSYNDAQPQDLLAAYRFSGTMHLSNDDIGFRVVLEKAQ
jgi:formylglycine-generating enzyme required for sulfatase activity